MQKAMSHDIAFCICGGGEHDLRHVRAESNEKPVYEIISKKLGAVFFRNNFVGFSRGQG